MSDARRLRRKQKRNAASEAKSAGRHAQRSANVPVVPNLPQHPAIPYASLWLAAAFLIPNLGALACGFVFDDRVLIVDNQSFHARSLRELAQAFHHVWTSGYWPDNRSLGLFRPVTETLWAILWFLGGGHPFIFHAAGLALGAAVVLLLYRFFLEVKLSPGIAFIAAALFALFPIHTEATTSVVGSAELLAAAFALGALIFYYRNRPVAALLLFALAVFSKESAAAFAVLPLVFRRYDPGLRTSSLAAPDGASSRFSTRVAAGGAGAIIAVALLVHHSIARGSSIPAIDNPMALVSAAPRIFTALWVQCLYVFKAFLPITLSADYSYKQIPLVMGFGDWRAWVGMALLGGAAYLAWRRTEFRAPVLAYAILFSPTANILFPIGTIMGERLVYAPSIGLAVLLAILLARSPHWKTILVAIALVFGARTATRNLDWLNPTRFYTALERTSPHAAKSHYSIGVMLSAGGDDADAIEAYDLAIAIFPAYAEAYRNRGNALARLGRHDEAMNSYRLCLRFDPGDYAARTNLRQLEAGVPVNPARAKL